MSAPPLTVPEHSAFPGDPKVRHELQEGAIIRTARRSLAYQHAVAELAQALRPLPFPVRLDLDDLV